MKLRSRLCLVIVLLFICCGGALAQSVRFYDEPLAEVKEFHGASIGMGGIPSPYYMKFQAEVEKGKASVPLLEQVLREGTPSARLYAALALYSIDNRRGFEALESLQGDTSRISTLFDCTRGGGTVEEHASIALERYRQGKKDFFLRLKSDDDPKDFLWR